MKSFDLRALAYRAMKEAGFEPDLPPGAAREIQAINMHQHAPPSDFSLPDMRNLLWSSIDNDDSRDLDQIEYAERTSEGAIKVMIGIADVDDAVPRHSVIDSHASANTTSVYTPTVIFPMLPEQLSTDATSLLGDADRLAVIIEMSVAANGEVGSPRIYRAIIRNHAKLTYEGIGAWLEGKGPAPEKVAAIAGLSDQIRLQDEATDHLQDLRHRNGALNLETIEARAVIDDGNIVDIVAAEHNRAHGIIESFMVAANSAMAEFLESKHVASIRRVVRKPTRWPRIVELAEGLGEHLPADPDPLALSAFLTGRKSADADHFPDLSLAIVKLLGPGEYAVERPGEDQGGHFGLAVHDYTHSTAPNRRFADLVTQRLVKAVLHGDGTPYPATELDAIAARCTERENAAKKIERMMRKAATALILSPRIGESFDAIVTGASPKGTYVRLLVPPAEGRVMRGEQGLDVGDRVRVRLLSTDAERGYIDFAAEATNHHAAR